MISLSHWGMFEYAPVEINGRLYGPVISINAPVRMGSGDIGLTMFQAAQSLTRKLRAF